MPTETNATDRIMSVDEMAAKLGVHRDTVLRWSQGSRPKLPAVRLAKTVRFHWPTVAKRLGIALAFVLLSPTTPAASPHSAVPAASPASKPAAGAPLSEAITGWWRQQVAGSNTTVPTGVSRRPGARANFPKPRVGTGGGDAPPVCTSPVGGVSPNNLGPTAPAPSSVSPSGGRWFGIDLAKLAQAESRGRDGAVGASGERGRLQITRAALADVNKARPTKIRFASLTNAATSAEVARAYVEILARRIRSAGYEATPGAILCAWNDGFRDARRYHFDPARAPYATRRLVAAQ